MSVSRTRQLGKSIGSTLAGQATTMIVGVVFLAYFGRKLPKEEMALFAYVTTLGSWVTLFSGLGLATLACREVPTLVVQGKHGEARRLITSALVYRTLLGVVVAAVLFWLAPFISRQAYGSEQYTGQFRFIAGIALITSIYGTLSLMQWALQRFHVKAAANVISALGGRFLAVLGYLWLGIDGFLLGFALGTFAAGAFQLWSLRDYIGRELMGLLSALRQGASYTGADMLRNLMMNLDQPIVGFLIGDAALAEFFVAKRLYAAVWAALHAVANPVGAKFSEVKVGGQAALNDYFRKSMFFIGFLFVPAGFAVIVISPAMLNVVVGAKYVGAAPLLSLFGITMVVACTHEIWYDAVVRLLPGYFVIIQNAVVSLATFGMYIVFLPPLAAKGIPLATAMGYVVATAFASRMLYVRVGLSFPFGPYVRSILCGLLVMMATWGASCAGNTITGLAAMTAAGAGAWAIGLLVLAPPEVRSWFQRGWFTARARVGARLSQV